jgi:hypothetical protein
VATELIQHSPGGYIPQGDRTIFGAGREAGGVAGELQGRQVGLALEPAQFGQRGCVEEYHVAAVGDGDDGTVRTELDAAAHRHLEITDDQIRAVLGHLDRALAAAEINTSLRTKVIAVVTRLWYARRF